jgi:hypothetical protein
MASSEFPPSVPVEIEQANPVALLAQIDVRSSQLAHLHATERLLIASIAEDQERVQALTRDNSDLPIFDRIAWAVALEGDYSASQRHDRMTAYKEFIGLIDAQLQVADIPVMTVRKGVHQHVQHPTMRHRVSSADPVALLDAVGTGLVAGGHPEYPLTVDIEAVPRDSWQLNRLAKIKPRELVAVHTEEFLLAPETVSRALEDENIIRVVGAGAIEAFIAASAQIGKEKRGSAWQLAEVVGETKL